MRQQGLPVVDHDFLDSFSLDVETKASHYLQLLHELPAGLSEWAVHRVQATLCLGRSTTVGEFVVLILNS